MYSCVIADKISVKFHIMLQNDWVHLWSAELFYTIVNLLQKFFHKTIAKLPYIFGSGTTSAILTNQGLGQLSISKQGDEQILGITIFL
jgi:hypothetical protein